MTACLKWILAIGLILSAQNNLRAELIVVNDGSSTTNLVKLSNLNGSGGAVTTLTTNQDGTLTAAQSPVIAELPLRTVWFPADRFATGAVYSVSADFKPAVPESRNRGGVMGWLNLASRIGIGVQVSPSADSTLAFFQLAVVDFTATDESANESFTNLFNLDGSDATGESTSALSEMGNYDPSKFATVQLEFAAPAAADQTNLSKRATAHITGKVLQMSSDGTTNQVGRTIELLTDLAPPVGSDHRFGYYAFWGSLFAEGSTIGQLDNLSFDGGLGAATNSPPAVSLTSPTNGSTFNVPVDITLTADAFDREGTITRVDFFNHESLIGSVTNSPYSIIWSNVPPGSHSLSARASDDRLTAFSTNVVQITVSNSPPSVVITSPASDLTVTAPVDVTIVAEASDPDGTVAGVDFFAGTTFLGTSMGEDNIFTLTWTNVPPGSYALTVLASDDWGSTTVSTNALNVTVNPPPATEPVPLTIARAANTVTISWPPASSGFQLQSKTNLSASVWADVPTLNNTFTLPSTNSAGFFRLKSL